MVVGSGAKHLFLFCRHGRVSLDQRRHHAAFGFDAQCQWSHVQQQNVLAVARQNRALNSRSNRDDFIRIDAFVWILAENFLHHRLDFGNASRTTHQNDFVDVAGRKFRVLQRSLKRSLATFNQNIDQLFELGTRNVHLQVLGTARIGRNERQVDRSLLCTGKFFLGIFAAFLKTLQRHRVGTQINAGIFFEFVRDVVDQDFVKVVTTEVRVTTGADDFENFHSVIVVQFQNGYVEGTATQVKDDDLLFFLRFVQAIRHRSSGRLVDNTSDLKASDLTGVFCRLPLSVVEVSRNRDDGLVHLVTEVGFGCFLELAKRFGRDFLRRVLFAIDLDFDVLVSAAFDFVRNHFLFGANFVVTTTHESFDRIHGTMRVGHALVSSRCTDKRLTAVRECDDARRRASAFLVCNHDRLVPFHDGDNGVGGTKVDTDDFFTLSHDCSPQFKVDIGCRIADGFFLLVRLPSA